ncbi:MAG: hypothetical protein K1Y36_12050 [Blastocatellia bacterium]|nr:hypothetical protein [Blastocatellia bacterium]
MRLGPQRFILLFLLCLGTVNGKTGVTVSGQSSVPPVPPVGSGFQTSLLSRQLSARTFTDREGLPQNSVEAMVFDQKGYLWVGTQDGAAFFNGRAWNVVNLPNRAVSNNVYSILVAADGSVWFGSNGRIAMLRQGKWTTFDATQGLPSGQVRSLIEAQLPDGTPVIWAGTRSGLAVLVKGSWQRVDMAPLPSTDILRMCHTIAADGNRQLWVGTRKGLGVLTISSQPPFTGQKPGQWEYFDTKNGLPGDVVWSFLETSEPDGAKCLWVGTSGGLAAYCRSQWAIIPMGAGFPGNDVVTLLETTSLSGEPTLWAGTLGGGLACRHQGRWEVLSTATGFPSNSIISLLESSAPNPTHTLWVGTAGGGLVRVHKRDWMAFDTSLGLSSNIVFSFLETTDEAGNPLLWVGTQDGGITRCNQGSGFKVQGSEKPAQSSVLSPQSSSQPSALSPQPFPQSTAFPLILNSQFSILNSKNSGLPNDNVLSLLETTASDSKRTLWAGTFGGLACLHEGKWKTIDTSAGLPNNRVFCLLESTSPGKGKQLWIGTSGGLARLPQTDLFTRPEMPQLTVFNTKNSGLPNDQIYCLRETVSRSGTVTLWVGTNGGLARFENGTWTVEDFKTGLPNNQIRDLLTTTEADGTRMLWVATRGGLAWRNLDGSLHPWHVLSDETQPALPNNTVFRVQEDAQKRLYLSTNKGIVQLTRRTRTHGDPAEFDMYVFTSEDGLPSNECNQGASLLDQAGRIWVGTVGGAAVFDPRQENHDTAPKPLFLEKIRVAGKDWAGFELDGLRGKAFNHNQNNLVFEYALLAYFRESDTRYQTQLVGVDAAPSPWVTDGKKEYTTLPEGRYRFKVWARDYAGNVSGPVEFAFSVKPAPWRTWWAYALYSLAAVALASGMINHRLQVLRNAEILGQKARLEEANLKLKELDQIKANFTAMLVHDLKSPLSVVKATLDMFEMEDAIRESGMQKLLGTSTRSVEKMLAMVNEILEVFRSESHGITLKTTQLASEPLLREFAEETRLAARSKNIQVTTDIKPDLPSIVADREKIGRVFSNLLSNAIKFTPSGGTITIEAHARPGTGVEAGLTLLVVSITDTGDGIPAEEIPYLFDPYRQAKSSHAQLGVGLGLAIVKRIVAAHGGNITVRSQIGVGSCFTVELPADTTG